VFGLMQTSHRSSHSLRRHEVEIKKMKEKIQETIIDISWTEAVQLEGLLRKFRDNAIDQPNKEKRESMRLDVIKLLDGAD
jgi:hypothetical protein